MTDQAQDKAEIEVEELLPCRMLDGSTCSGNPNWYEHSEACPANYRPAVAAKLWERDKLAAEQISDVASRMADDINALKSQLAQREQEVERFIELASLESNAKEKAAIEGEEEAKRLWSVTITMLRDGQDLNSAMIAAIAAKLRERDAQHTEELAELSSQIEELQAAHAECSFVGARLMSSQTKVQLLESQLATAESKNHLLSTRLEMEQDTVAGVGIDLGFANEKLAAADAEITNLKLELDCKHTSNLQCHFYADQICKRHAIESMKSQLAAANSEVERLKEAHRQTQLLDAQFAQLEELKAK